jgi:hypothetical protein
VNAPFGTILGGWYRFDAYEVRDGYIRPAPGASGGTYDPWTSFRSRERGEPVECAHDALLRLVEAVDANAAATESLIAAWCNQYGLLGVLPHRVEAVSLAARWEHPGAPVPKGAVWPVWRHYVRASDRWMECWEFPEGFQDAFARPDQPPAGFPLAGIQQRGRLVPRARCSKAWGRPAVVLRVPLSPGATDGLGVERPEQQPLSSTWSRYFPTVPESERDTYPYPCPGTVEFWRLYAEPVQEFIGAARRLRDALRDLDQVSFPERPDDVTVLESTFLEARGLTRLHMLTAPLKVAVAFDPLTNPIRVALTPTERGFYRQIWVSPSLLSSIGMMALVDRVGSPPRCKSCGKDLVPGRSIGIYCSARCRETGRKAQKRRRAAGKPFPEIAHPGPTRPRRTPPKTQRCGLIKLPSGATIVKLL